MPANAITTERLTKRYGTTLALDRLDLTVQAGEVYGYLGPNGAGKTTTIRLLLGLHQARAGRADLFGVDAWDDPVTAHRRVAYVPAQPFRGTDAAAMLAIGLVAGLAALGLFRRRDLLGA